MQCRGPILFPMKKMRNLKNMLMGISQRKHTGPRPKVGSEGVDELNFQKNICISFYYTF